MVYVPALKKMVYLPTYDGLSTLLEWSIYPPVCAHIFLAQGGGRVWVLVRVVLELIGAITI
jgi:hypothetical protein